MSTKLLTESHNLFKLTEALVFAKEKGLMDYAEARNILSDALSELGVDVKPRSSARPGGRT